MSVFKFLSYRQYLLSFIKAQPRRGHGEISRIADHLNVKPTLISMVLNEKREFSVEQACLLTTYLKLTKLEAEYFLWLVQYSRAGHHLYREFAKSKIEELRSEANKMVKRYPHESVLSNEEKTQFYSSWIYSAVRLFTSTSPKGVAVESLVERFQLERQRIVEVLGFLVGAGLVLEENGKYKMGPKRTFVEAGSPHVLKHHTNWRLKALQQADRISQNELMFTTPISISRTDFEKLREELANWLKHFSDTVKDSPAEEIACLNIDFFWVHK